MTRIAVNTRHKGKQPADLSPEAASQWQTYYSSHLAGHDMHLGDVAGHIVGLLPSWYSGAWVDEMTPRRIARQIEKGVNNWYKGGELLPAVDADTLHAAIKGAFFSWYNGEFHNQAMTVDELGDLIRQGYGYTTWHRRYRKADNFILGQHLGLDMDTEDERSTFDALLSDPFITRYAALLHTTASHTPEAPRARVIFLLDRPIRSAAKYAELAEALVWRYGGDVDTSCKDPARLFFGAEACDMHTLGNVLTLEEAAELLVFPYREHKRRQAEIAAERAQATVTVDAGDIAAELLKEHADKLLARVRTAPEGEKYYILRDISRTFGGYVAGGYWQRYDARAWLQAAIETRRATVKSMQHAYATIDEGLAYGMSDPLYFELPEQTAEQEPEAAPTWGVDDSWQRLVLQRRYQELDTLIRELPAGDPAWAPAVAEYARIQERIEVA